MSDVIMETVVCHAPRAENHARRDKVVKMVHVLTLSALMGSRQVVTAPATARQTQIVRADSIATIMAANHVKAKTANAQTFVPMEREATHVPVSPTRTVRTPTMIVLTVNANCRASIPAGLNVVANMKFATREAVFALGVLTDLAQVVTDPARTRARPAKKTAMGNVAQQENQSVVTHLDFAVALKIASLGATSRAGALMGHVPMAAQVLETCATR